MNYYYAVKLILLAGIFAAILLVSSRIHHLTPNCPSYNGHYYLNQQDSPLVANVHPEVDLISNNTIYTNWYQNTPAHEYQIEVEPDSIFLFDKDRLIGSVKHSDNPLDSLLAVDNQ